MSLSHPSPFNPTPSSLPFYPRAHREPLVASKILLGLSPCRYSYLATLHNNTHSSENLLNYVTKVVIVTYYVTVVVMVTYYVTMVVMVTYYATVVVMVTYYVTVVVMVTYNVTVVVMVT